MLGSGVIYLPFVTSRFFQLVAAPQELVSSNHQRPAVPFVGQVGRVHSSFEASNLITQLLMSMEDPTVLLSIIHVRLCLLL